MKNKILLFALIIVFASCEKSDMDECYRMSPDVTEGSCLSEKCQLKQVSMEFISRHGCVTAANSGYWWSYSARPVMPLCYPIGNPDGDYQESVDKVFCKDFSKTAVFVLVLQQWDPDPPREKGWYPCNEKLSSCPETTCGNGVGEPGEECDFPSTIDFECREGQMQHGWGKYRGYYSCDDTCRLDFSSCY